MDKPTAAAKGYQLQYGALFHNGIKVATVTLHKALASFISFLRSLKQPVLLAAHDARRFDKPVLDRSLFRCSLTQQFQQLGVRFLDTLLLSKALYPGLDSYEQGVLSYPFLGNRNNAYNALKNVTDLQELYGCWNPDQESVAQCVL